MKKQKRLTNEEKQQIRKLYRNGISTQVIAEEMNCAISTVYYTLNNKQKEQAQEIHRNRVLLQAVKYNRNEITWEQALQAAEVKKSTFYKILKEVREKQPA